MKKATLLAILLVILVTSFGQQITSSPVSAGQDYLTKAKSQKKTAKTLLIGGGALIATSIIVLAPGTVSFDGMVPLLALAGVGGVSALGSIPLFIASGKNKRRAMKASTYIQLERVSYIRQQDIAFHRYPALSVKIHF